MKTAGFFKGSALTLACLGVVAPQPVLAARPLTAHLAGDVQIADIALSAGTLNGKVVDGEGRLLSGTVVKISQAKREVASTQTNETGEFTIANLSSGVYQVSAGQAQGAIRLWDAQVAPPAAKNDILLVSGDLTARGQTWIRSYSPRTLIISGVVVATAIAIPIALNSNDDDDHPSSP